MKALYNWILNAKGRGKRYLLVLALVFASTSSFVVYTTWNNLVQTPDVKAFIASMPPLTIQNGQIIEPSDSYKDIVFNATGVPYHLIIDTRPSEIDFTALPKRGVYLTKNNMYVLNGNSIMAQSLANIPNIKMAKQDWSEILEKGSIRFSWILFFTLTLTLFVVFYFWSLLFALLSYILTLFVPAEKYTFPVRRRVSVVSLIIGYIIFIPLSFVQLYLSTFAFFFTVLLIMSFILATLPKSYLFTVDNQ